MKSGDSKYIIRHTAAIRDALIALDKLSGGVLTLFVVDESSSIMLGTLTDGDIRRNLIKGCTLENEVSVAMNKQFSSINSEVIDVEYIRFCKRQGIKLLPMLNSENRIMRILDLVNLKSVLPIDAILMAGGKGERLRPLTEKTPKPLVKIGEKCIIDYNIDSLISYGVENIHVTVNYLKEQLEEHFKTPKEGILINCVREPQFLGTIGSAKFIPSFIHDTILVMNSDLFTNVDYEDFYLHFVKNNADISVLSIPYSYNIPYGIFELDGRNIKGITEKPTHNYYANGGIYLMKKRVFDLIPNNQCFDATDLISIAIERGLNVIRFPLTGYWIDIGKHEDYNKAQELVKHIYG